MLDLENFKQTLNKNKPPDDLAGVLRALWWDAKDDWRKAHEVAQEINDADGSWVHAYLHRKEGDEGNAGYWYHRAQKSKSSTSLEEEWEELVSAFLKKY